MRKGFYEYKGYEMDLKRLNYKWEDLDPQVISREYACPYKGFPHKDGYLELPYGLTITNYKNREKEDVEKGIKDHCLVIDYLKKISNSTYRGLMGQECCLGLHLAEACDYVKYDSEKGYVVERYYDLLDKAERQDYSLFFAGHEMVYIYDKEKETALQLADDSDLSKFIRDRKLLEKLVDQKCTTAK